MAWNDGKDVSIENGPTMDSAAKSAASFPYSDIAPPVRRWLAAPCSPVKCPSSSLIRSAQSAKPLGWIAAALQNLHQCRAYDNPINMSAQQLHLLAAADTKTCTNGDLGQRAHAIEIPHHFVGYGHIPARRARHRHCIYEALAAGAKLFHPLRLGDRRDHLNQGDPMRIQCFAQVAALVVRQIRHYESCYVRARCCIREAIQAVSQEWIEVTHEQERCVEAGHRFELGQNPAQADSLCQGSLTRALYGYAVRHRIRERHANLDDIRACGNRLQVFAKLALARVSGG